MLKNEISIKVENGKIVVDSWEATVNRGDVVAWNTKLAEGATIVPRQDGLTVLKRTAEVGAPAVALATNAGYYQYDVYCPGLETLLGGSGQDPQRVVAVLIVSEYKAP